MNIFTTQTNPPGQRFTRFELSLDQLKEQLAEVTGVETVEVIRYDDAPTTVVLNFKKNEEWGN